MDESVDLPVEETRAVKVIGKLVVVEDGGIPKEIPASIQSKIWVFCDTFVFLWEPFSP